MWQLVPCAPVLVGRLELGTDIDSLAVRELCGEGGAVESLLQVPGFKLDWERLGDILHGASAVDGVYHFWSIEPSLGIRLFGVPDPAQPGKD